MEQLLKLLQEMMQSMKTIIANQERFQERFSADLERFKSEQGRAGAALGETGAILLNHADALRTHNTALRTLCEKAGIPLKEASPETPPIVN